MARILVADDSAVIRIFYDNLLVSLGHEVILCKDGQEALDKFAVEHVDLMILDVEMPRKSGIEACREIRQQPRGLNVPIIIVSSCQDEDEILEGLSAGANDYLLKPVKENLLIARLRNLLKTSILHNSDYEIVKNKVIWAERYKVQKIIGYGRHSIVFMVDDLKEDNKKKVLKLLNENIRDPALLADYLATAENFSKINSEYITKTLEAGQSCGRCYLVMEYISGGDLRGLLATRKLSVMEAVHLGLDISMAICDLSNHNMIHFDIKPENILIGENGHFKLADFGMLTTRDSETIPMNAEIWSTAAYISPEYINAEHDLTSKSDIYSLGVTIYEGLIRDNPFMSDKPMNSLYRQMNIDAPELALLDKKIPDKLSDAVKLMLAKNPESRPTPEECIDLFAALLDPDKHTWTPRTTLTPEEPPEAKERIIDDSSAEAATTDIPKSEKTIEILDKIAAQANIPSSAKNNLWHKMQKVAGIIILCIACLLCAYCLGVFISSFFADEIPVENELEAGPVTTIICTSCNKVTKKRCKDVSKEKCAECSAMMAIAAKCMKCGKIFAETEENPDNDEDILCRHCKSKRKSFQ